MATIIDVDFENTSHCKAVIDLMNHYMCDKMGGVEPHTPDGEKRLIDGLRKQGNKLCLLAKIGEEFVGLTNCFIGFGTFAAKPYINIHDVVVRDTYRGKGIGRAMLEEINKKAIEMDCGKITLEVREDNPNAQHLYKSLGFNEGTPIMHFWTKYL